ncbi:MAG: MBL fold metallo-hydrolase, partial [Armatimonadota bacterium]
MFFRKFHSPGIAHISYMIGSRGHAAVIDPRRDVDEYIDVARSEGLKITHIFETHRNEDYVIGSVELSQMTGAEIYHGSELPFEYGSAVGEGDEFKLGHVKLSVLHTPGHT